MAFDKLFYGLFHVVYLFVVLYRLLSDIEIKKELKILDYSLLDVNTLI